MKISNLFLYIIIAFLFAASMYYMNNAVQERSAKNEKNYCDSKYCLIMTRKSLKSTFKSYVDFNDFEECKKNAMEIQKAISAHAFRDLENEEYFKVECIKS